MSEPTHSTPTEAGDRRLFRRMRRGDQRAALALWRAHAPRLTAYARSIAGSSAEDAVQETFFAAIRLSGAEARRIRDIGAWLTAVTRRRALNIARTEGRERDRRSRASTAAEVPVVTPRDESVWDALCDLEPAERDPIQLHQLAGLTFSQVAGVLGEPRSTIADRYARGMARLRDLIQSDAGDPDQGTISNPEHATLAKEATA